MTTVTTEPTADTVQREGILVTPEQRLSDDDLRLIDGVSRDLLYDPGLLCYNAQATELFKKAGCTIEGAEGCVRVRMPGAVLDKALQTAPSRIVLGGRHPEDKLILDAHEPRVRFGTGSETNIWLDVSFNEDGAPSFERQPGSIRRLRDSAHLCNQLDHLDFFLRNVNIQDASVTEANKDVNKYLASLNNTARHVQAGLTSLDALDDVIALGTIVAGGPEAFEAAPPVSFITCVIKSPLQVVDDTATKLIEMAKRRVPVVVSSCPMGGATGPFDEFAMVAQINAELLAGVAITQLVSPGAPVLYGAVPVRTRLDNLNDMYGAPEFVHYNIDCAQMARFYGLPCYSTAGVGDADRPGIQATAEKMLTLMTVPRSGAQYIHYAFGLLDRTNVFCPEQAVMDDAHIGLVKKTLVDTTVRPERRGKALALVREVMASSHKTYVYNLPLPTRDDVYVRYPLEHERDALYAAHLKVKDLMNTPRQPLPPEMLDDIRARVPGVLPETLL